MGCRLGCAGAVLVALHVAQRRPHWGVTRQRLQKANMASAPAKTLLQAHAHIAACHSLHAQALPYRS